MSIYMHLLYLLSWRLLSWLMLPPLTLSVPARRGSRSSNLGTALGALAEQKPPSALASAPVASGGLLRRGLRRAALKRSRRPIAEITKEEWDEAISDALF